MTDYAAARQAMVDCQVRPSDVTRYAIIEAMLWAPRELFVSKARRDVAYAGAEVELAPGRVLLEPRTLAKMLEAEAGVTPAPWTPAEVGVTTPDDADSLEIYDEVVRVINENKSERPAACARMQAMWDQWMEALTLRRCTALRQRMPVRCWARRQLHAAEA
jgi:hypothetical protein